MKKNIAILFLVISTAAFAQKKKKATDTNQQALKEFIEVCNRYKQFPLHVTIQETGSATFPAPGDTTNTIADYFLTPSGAYIRYGNIEQLVDDSMMVMVNNDQKVMIISAVQHNMQTQLDKYLGHQYAGSSLEKMEQQYTATIKDADKDISLVELTNRATLPGTDLLKEAIRMKYRTGSKEPVEIIYLRRSLIVLDSADGEEVKNNGSVKDKLVVIKNNYFLVNERIKTYRFNKIDHDRALRLPVLASDRIIRKNGDFIPAKGFEDYYISVD